MEFYKSVTHDHHEWSLDNKSSTVNITLWGPDKGVSVELSCGGC